MGEVQERTAGNWYRQGSGSRCSIKADTQTYIARDVSEADAATIVKCCNGYQKLAGILSAIPAGAIAALARKRQVDEDGELVGVSHQAVDEIYAALMKARAVLTDLQEDDNGRK